MNLRKVLIVEDSASRQDYLTELLQIIGFEAHAVKKKTDFLVDLQRQNPDLVLLCSCDNPWQLKAFAKVVEREKKGLPILLIGDPATTEKQGKNLGATKMATLHPSFKADDLKLSIDRLITDSQHSDYHELDNLIIGQSLAMVRIKKNIVRLSKSDVTVLITGESGTGKELVAQAMHKLSPRSQNPFVKVNSAALPANLLESELFGFEKGAFTGAWQKKPGKFKLAHSGSLLLDEIGEISLPLQAKLLQVLEDKELSTLGSTRNTEIDVRVFAATNANLAQMVSDGRFRSDLFYRLNVVAISIPPLRQRKEDIAALTNYYLKKYAVRYGRQIGIPDGRIQDLFYEYSWPGNVRELENIIQSIVILGNEDSFWEKLKNQFAMKARHDGDGPFAAVKGSNPSESIPLERRSLKDVCKEAARKAETEAILEVLSHTRWNRRMAAELPQVSYKALLNKIREYQVEEHYRNLLRSDRKLSDRGESSQRGFEAPPRLAAMKGGS